MGDYYRPPIYWSESDGCYGFDSDSGYWRMDMVEVTPGRKPADAEPLGLASQISGRSVARSRVLPGTARRLGLRDPQRLEARFRHYPQRVVIGLSDREVELLHAVSRLNHHPMPMIGGMEADG